MTSLSLSLPFPSLQREFPLSCIADTDAWLWAGAGLGRLGWAGLGLRRHDVETDEKGRMGGWKSVLQSKGGVMISKAKGNWG